MSAVETRKKNEEIRKAKEQKEKRIKEAMIDALLAVLESDQASIDQKLEATVILYGLRR